MYYFGEEEDYSSLYGDLLRTSSERIEYDYSKTSFVRDLSNYEKKIRDTQESLFSAVNDQRPIYFFGAVPPPKKCSEEVVDKSIKNLSQLFTSMQPDAVIVYDIQDEKSRNGEERPFPFFETHDPREFGCKLQKKTSIETILYQALNGRQKATFKQYLSELHTKFEMKNVVFVGAPPSSTDLTVPEATQLALDHELTLSPPKGSLNRFFLGGVTIPERHRNLGDEHERLLNKQKRGVSFFTSQVIYNADNAISMLRDYDERCRTEEVNPCHIVLSFAPFGRESTANFLQWLGVEISKGTSTRILRRGNRQACISESLQICWENLRRILDAHRRMGLKIPLGVAVESVSKYRDEQQGAEELFYLLREEMHFWHTSGGLKPVAVVQQDKNRSC